MKITNGTRITISGFWDRTNGNLGLQALSEGLLTKVQALFPQASVDLLSFEKNFNIRGIGLLTKLFPHPLSYRLVFYFTYLYYRMTFRARIAVIKRSDVLIINGDGVVADIFMMEALLLTLDMKVARDNNLRVFSLDQSINARPGSFVYDLVKTYFLKSNISVRDRRSLAAVEKMLAEKGAQQPGIDLAVDCAFLVPPLTDEEIRTYDAYLSDFKKKYSFTDHQFLIFGMRRNRPQAQPINIPSWRNVLMTLENEFPDLKIIFATTCPEFDIPLGKRMQRLVPDLIVIEELMDWQKYNYRFILYFLSKCRLCLTDRYHQNVFCLLMGVPFIPVMGNTDKTLSFTDVFDYPVPVLPLPDEDNHEEYVRQIRAFKRDIALIQESLKSIPQKICRLDNYERFLNGLKKGTG